MISQANSSVNLRTAYNNNNSQTRDVEKKGSTNVSSQGDTSKVEQMKEALASGEYKVNLQSLSEKIADDILGK